MKQALYFVFALFYIMMAGHTAHAAPVGKIAAVVNGQMITMYDLEVFANPELQQRKLNPKNPAQKKEVDAVLRQALELMVMDVLLAHEAEKLKVNVSDAEVDEEFKRTLQRRKVDEATFLAQVKKEGFTRDMVKDRMKKGIMRQKLMGMMVGRKVVVTPEEVKQYFEEHKTDFTNDKSPRMALLVYHEKADAEMLSKKIKSGAVSFEEVVKHVSIGPNREGGGDVGPMKWKELAPSWKERLSSLSPGQVSSIFDLEGKKAQIKLLSMNNTSRDVTFEEVAPEIENILREPRLQERFKEVNDQLRKKAVIDVRF